MNRCALKLYETPTEHHKTTANMQRRAGKTQYLYHIVHYGRRQTHIPQSLSLIITRERKLISSSVSSQIPPSCPPHIVKYHSRAEHDPNCKSFSSVYSNPLSACTVYVVCSSPLHCDVTYPEGLQWFGSSLVLYSQSTVTFSFPFISNWTST